MLTEQQSDLLAFLRTYTKKSGGVSPSFDEMKDALDLASKCGIGRLLTALEERGFVRRLRNRARAIEIVERPTAKAKTTNIRNVAAEIVSLVGPDAARLRTCAVPAELILALREAL